MSTLDSGCLTQVDMSIEDWWSASGRRTYGMVEDENTVRCWEGFLQSFFHVWVLFFLDWFL